MKSTLLALLLVCCSGAVFAAKPVNQLNLCSNTRETVVNLVDTTITDAAGKGDVETLKQAFKNGVSVNATTHEGFSLLHLAITRHQDEVIKLLIEHGVDVNQPFNGSSPLQLFMFSSANSAADQAREKMLLKAGAALSEYDRAFETTRQYRARSRVDGFIEAIKKSDMVRLKEYVRATYNINAPLTGSGIPPIHIAVAERQPEVIRYLVQCGADVNSRTKKGAPVLWFAKDHPDMVELLRSLGATAAE